MEATQGFSAKPLGTVRSGDFLAVRLSGGLQED